MSIFGQDFDDAVTRLKNAAANFSDTYSQFVSIPPDYQSSTWSDTKTKADIVQNTILTFTNAIDYAYNWIGNTFGLQGLGILPALAVPWLTVAAIGGAIAAIIASIGYMNNEIQQSKIIQMNIDRVNQGMNPINPSDITGTAPSATQSISNAAQWLAIGAIAVFVLPKLIEQYRKRK